MGNLSLVCGITVFAADQFGAVAKAPDLDKPHAQGQIKTGADKHNQGNVIAPKQSRELPGPGGQLRKHAFHCLFLCCYLILIIYGYWRIIRVSPRWVNSR